MSLSICQNVSATYNRVTCLRSLLCALVEGLFNRGNVLVWYIITGRGVLKNARHIGFRVVNIVIYGLQITDHTSILTSSSTLFLVQIVEFGLLSD